MYDALRYSDMQALADGLAAAFAIEHARAVAVLRAIAPEFAWYLQKNTLSRGGLADLVEALGSGHHAGYVSGGSGVFTDAAVRADGDAILGHLLRSKHASRALAARVARRSGVDAATVVRMLPCLAAVTMGTLALRALPGLDAIVANVPPLGRLSRGNAHADLAGILRRRCGAGHYSPRALPRAVRRAIAGPAGFSSGSIFAWYFKFMGGRSAARMMRALAVQRPATHGTPAN
jgi:hypothetical protein